MHIFSNFATIIDE